jgi:hypothetical protein
MAGRPVVAGRTRTASGDAGAPSPLLHPGLLNDNRDVIAAVKFENINLDTKEAIEKVTEQIKQKFNMVNPKLPLISNQNIMQKITRLMQTEHDFKRKKLSKAKAKNFTQKQSKLFDVISCQCKIFECSRPETCCSPETCSGFHISCSCAKYLRIPDMETSFVKDQREKEGTLGGKQVMVGVDSKDAKKGRGSRTYSRRKGPMLKNLRPRRIKRKLIERPRERM